MRLCVKYERATPLASPLKLFTALKWLHTDDFWRDYHAYKAKGVVFIREPAEHPYGTVAVFQDLYGNLWDLLEPKSILEVHRESRLLR